MLAPYICNWIGAGDLRSSVRTVSMYSPFVGLGGIVADLESNSSVQVPNAKVDWLLIADLDPQSANRQC